MCSVGFIAENAFRFSRLYTQDYSSRPKRHVNRNKNYFLTERGVKTIENISFFFFIIIRAIRRRAISFFFSNHKSDNFRFFKSRRKILKILIDHDPVVFITDFKFAD